MAETPPSIGPATTSALADETITEEPPHDQQQQQQQQQPQPEIIADVQPKRKGRQRLFRGLNRMSSSPSLAQFGRARSASTPYTRSGASLSCVSLASTPSPFAPSSSSGDGSGFPFSQLASPLAGSSSTYSLSSPPTSSPLPGTPSECHAIRKVSLTPHANGYGGTVPLPADIARVVSSSRPLSPPRSRRTLFQMWAEMPREIKIHIFGYFQPKELVRLSRVNREFHKLCFDGQLWTCFDASEFYKDIPVESLSNIITKAGPFVRDLNLRGCIQIEKYNDGAVMSRACSNLVNATLEGSLFNFHNLETLLQRNRKLAQINLTGLGCVNLNTCITIAFNCAQIEVLNLSWCKNVTAENIDIIVKSCTSLRDLRVSEIRGFDNRDVADTLFRTNRLERLVMSGCLDLSDAALATILHGKDPEIDLLTDRPRVPPRRLRHLDLSRCKRLTSRGVAALGHCVPELEGLVLAGCGALTDAALEPILDTCPRLAYLDLEDLTELTNPLFSEHLAKAACAERMTHLCIGYCEGLGDAGVLPAIRACKSLRSIDMDNTRVSDLVLAEAAAMVRTRAARTRDRATRPRPGLSMTVYDCPNINWTGVREVLSRNAEILMPRAAAAAAAADTAEPVLPTFPTEIISLKCFYGWQMTVDEHTKRVLRGDYAAAARLERKWADYMQANEEAGAGGAGGRRRRRRAREAQQAHADEEEGGGPAGGPAGGMGLGIGRRRARTATCIVM